LFIKNKAEGKILIISLYVDDLIFTGNDESMFVKFKSSMMGKFDMTDLGKMRRTDGIFINQKKYTMEVLKRCKFYHLGN
jgi:cell division GTPase FtsZ